MDRTETKLKGSLATCLNARFVSARELASITGQIIAMSCAVGNLTRLLTRNCYSAIEAVNHWHHKIVISPEIRYELQFWHNNIDSIYGRPLSPKSSAVAVVYSDSSDTGVGGYSVQCGVDFFFTHIIYIYKHTHIYIDPKRVMYKRDSKNHARYPPN